VFAAVAKALIDIDITLYTTLATFFVCLLAIGAWFTWLRLALRWLSITNVIFIRMEHIERGSNLRANLYVRHLNDDKAKCPRQDKTVFSDDPGSTNKKRPFLDKYFQKNLHDLTKAYEHRSQISMLSFLAWINIAAWLLLFIGQLVMSFVDPAQLQDNQTCYLLIVISVLGIVYGIFLYRSWNTD
jgi:hypothetical protein